MDIRKVKKLIELLEQSDVAEIEIHEGEESVRISRQGSVTAAPAISALAPQMLAPAAPVPQAPPTAAAEAPAVPRVVSRSTASGSIFSPPFWTSPTVTIPPSFHS